MAQIAKRKFFNLVKDVMDIPPLNSLQLESYRWFLKTGFRELLDEISPIQDFTGKLLELSIEDYFMEEPAVDETTARERNLTFKAPMRAKLKLTNKETGEIKETEVFFGEFPLMTDQGTFIVNGIERVVVAQIVRSPGVLFVAEESEGQRFYGAKIIPVRGAWLEIETNKRGIIWVKIDRKRKVPVTTMLRAFGFGTDDEIRAQFAGVARDPAYDFIEKTLERDPAKSFETGLVEVYKKIRPGDLATVENAKQLVQSMFFDFRRYDLGSVGRYKLNQRLGLSEPINRKTRVMLPTDLVAIVKEIINLAQSEAEPDDIDHLGNRRVRAVGELLQGKIRVGLLRMERIVKDRMSVSDLASATPAQLINVHPLTAALQEFFASSQLSQFMDQTNPLSELEHKRRVSAMGPGGLSRERASFEVRDVHASHYGRICPIETPEGPNVGLVGNLASYARVNQYGFIESPYRVVKHKGGKAYASTEIVYLDANEDQKAIIGQADLKLSPSGEILDRRVEARFYGKPEIVSIDKLEYLDVAPVQTVAVATGLIPFMEHDEAARASMGANMLRQAVPLIRPDSPVVGTGLEARAAIDSGSVILAEEAGVVTSSTAQHVKVMGKNGKEQTYHLQNFVRSNQALGIHQRPVVEKGEKVAKGDLLADSFSTDQGELALGQNVTVAFMPWGGGNFEDAILISERLVEQDRFTSIHIDNFRIEVRDTKLGPEVVTRDIPNVGEEALKNLDEEGIIRLGAPVSSGDILVGKITPKGETELTAEEKLLRAIFGEKARDVKDTSLRLPHGEYGKVVDIKIFSRDLGDELAAGVLQAIEISVAQLRKITVGDKMAGRHGNKGVISKVVPIEDMPYMEDGTPVDIVLNPLGIVSRMNLGQVLETHLGWAAQLLGYKVASPVFQGVPIETIEAEMAKAGIPNTGKIELFDGKSGRKFANKICVGVIYMMKLIHLVEDKIHARSTGPYATITQQPLGGKAQFGGQRFGEMEVWALQAYGAAHTLQEMLTIKSDDVLGRSKAYESIIKGEDIKKPSTPESFNVLTRELQSLGLKVDLLKKISPAKVKEVELTSVAEKEEEMRGTYVISADDVAEKTAERAAEKDVVEAEKERAEVDEIDVGVED